MGFLGEAAATFRPGEVEIKRSGKPLDKVSLDKVSYDNEQCVHLMRRLPLEIGYKCTLPVLASLAAGSGLPIGLEVTAKETVRVPAGEFECFKVVLSIGQTFWFTADAHRYLAKLEVAGATVSLTSIAQRRSDVPVPYRNDAAGISLTAPPDWVLHLRADDRPNRQTLHLLDPRADAQFAMLRVHRSESLTPVAKASARAWAESDFAEHAGKELKNAKLRADAWRVCQIGGRAGMSYIADYTHQDRPMVVYAAYALGGQASEHFALACAADQFAALKPAFDSIIASYRAK